MKSPMYPDGILRKDDEGSLAMKVGIYQGRVFIDFGKEVAWIAFDKNSLRVLIDSLEDKYKEI